MDKYQGFCILVVKMKLVTVTPINRGIFKENLTYFTSLEVSIGSIVKVPIKNKTTEALVLGIKEAKNQKSEIKKSDFCLKKVVEVKSTNFFLPEFLVAIEKTSNYFAAGLGQTIKAVLPKVIIENLTKIEQIDISQVETVKEDNVIKQNKFILQDDDQERISYYKSLIRESFAKKQSVLICLPINSETGKLAEKFGTGIRDYTVVINNDQSKKTILENWNKATSLKHPILIITTGNFLSIPRRDIKTIIIEKEGSGNYKNFNRPFIDIRFLAEKLSEELGARLIMGDLVLRTETIFKTEKGEYSRLSSLKYRSLSNADQLILDSRNNDSGDKSIYALSDSLKQIISETITKKEKIIIYSGRRGLSPTTICNDCGQIIYCRQCASPLVLHKNQEEKKYFYTCHKCGTTEEVEDKCPSCGSWRLSLLGIGLEKIEEEITSLWPETPLFKIEGENTKISIKNGVSKKFFETKGSAIMLGTELLISQIEEKVPVVIVAAIDALFSIPDFKISEKILNNLLYLRQLAEKKFIIQTRNPKEKVFRFAVEGNLIDFYREEIEERMKFGYPPFKILLKISYEAKKTEATSEIENLAKLLASYQPIVYPSLLTTENKYKLQILIKLAPSSWIDLELLGKIKSLSPNFIIDIEPNSIL